MNTLVILGILALAIGVSVAIERPVLIEIAIIVLVNMGVVLIAYGADRA